jgi:hypothetical protein
MPCANIFYDKPFMREFIQFKQSAIHVMQVLQWTSIDKN